jgi:hypothetical protein
MSTPTSYTLLAGGYRNTLATLRFTPPPTAASRETPGAATASGTLALISESPVPPNPSWLEVKNENVYTVSEVEGGTAVLAELVREEGAVVGVNVRQEVVVGDAPCHVAFEGDVVVVSNVSRVWAWSGSGSVECVWSVLRLSIVIVLVRPARRRALHSPLPTPHFPRPTPAQSTLHS